jgi:hypothetical protein
MSEAALRWADFAQYLEFQTDLCRPTRFDVALIEAIMLFPDDEVWRAKTATSSFVEWVGDDASTFTQERLAMHQRLTRDALPISEVHKEINIERHVRGVITGSFLHNVLVANILDLRQRSKNAIALDCLKPFKRTRERLDGFKLSLSTWNTEIWRTFRPVAHLWAASQRRAKKDGDLAFPCRADRFVEFLADAEFYRLQGEKITTARAHEPILRPGEAFALPKNLAVEPSKPKDFTN